MQHITPERLAELALAPHAEDAHLDECAACREELRSLRAEVGRLRVAAATPAPLPAGLWQRIADEVAEEPAPAAVAEPTAAAPASSPDRADRAHVATRRPRRSAAGGRARRFTAGALVLACAATAVVVGGTTAAVLALVQGQDTGRVVAAAPLDALTTEVRPAAAEVVERDGRRVLVLDAEQLPAVDGYLDVWLIDSDVQGMINVGILDADTHEYVLPEGVDLDRFPIVDVSVEPFDGDPTHSGDSIWRGVLGS